MGFCGDAVIAETKELEELWELQRLIFAQRKLVAEAQELAKGESLEAEQAKLREISEELSAARIENEEFRRELKRQESDLEVVERRIMADTERLRQSSNSKDIAGIQHELETLARRKSDLEDVELELMEQLEVSDAKLHELEVRREQKEQELQVAKQELELRLGEMKQENQGLSSSIAAAKEDIRPELLSVFETKLTRGLAVGRLVASSCSACNMSLNSQAMAEIGSVPVNELASCPECGAMLVRE